MKTLRSRLLGRVLILGAFLALPIPLLAQEAAILADRSDIAEELVRLRTHAGQLEALG